MDVREFLVRLIRYVIVAIAGAQMAMAGTIDPQTPDDKYVEFGKQFASVVRLRARVQCDKPECKIKEHDQFGSAVIIKPHWLLTAAHVVENTTQPVAIKDDGAEFPLQRVVIHPAFETDKLGHHDLALCYSPKEFALKFYSPLYKQQDELGKAITIAGYGMTGTFQTGATASDHRRRAGHNKIEGLERTVLVCSPSAGLTRFPLEFMIAPGDSGGGMFIGDELAGINSFLMAADKKPDGTYGDESAFTRVSLYTDWIERQIAYHELVFQGRATMGETADLDNGQ